MPLPTFVRSRAYSGPSFESMGYEQLGKAVSKGGPLDAKTRRLIKLALASFGLYTLQGFGVTCNITSHPTAGDLEIVTRIAVVRGPAPRS